MQNHIALHHASSWAQDDHVFHEIRDVQNPAHTDTHSTELGALTTTRVPHGTAYHHCPSCELENQNHVVSRNHAHNFSGEPFTMNGWRAPSTIDTKRGGEAYSSVHTNTHGTCLQALVHDSIELFRSALNASMHADPPTAPHLWKARPTRNQLATTTATTARDPARPTRSPLPLRGASHRHKHAFGMTSRWKVSKI